MFFLGDYIYEYAPEPGRIRRHRTAEARDLVSYRNRYAEHKLDAGLQAAHAAFPWVVIWDDHEVANNYVGNHPEHEGDADDFLARRADAYQVWYEHMPVRLPAPDGPDYAIHRSVAYGELAAFHALDTRQFRSEQACAYAVDAGPPCAAIDEPGRAVLGQEQEEWLAGALTGTPARWNILAQQTMLAERRMALGTIDEIYQLDAWDGYRPGRQRVIDLLVEHDVTNPVVLTGDIHMCLVADVHRDPHDGSTPVVATELGGVSMSSTHDAAGDVITTTSWEAGLMPHVHFLDSSSHGYLVCDVTEERLAAHFRLVHTIAEPVSPIHTGPNWVVEEGHPGAIAVPAGESTAGR